jgi:hypothetical protein
MLTVLNVISVISVNQYITFLTIILPLIGAAVGYFVRQYFDKRKELLGEVNIERRIIYQSFINLIITLFEEIEPTNYNKFRIDLNDFYKKYVLYASPGVISSLSDFIQLINQNDKEHVKQNYFSSLTKIILEMRRDLGLGNKNLGKKGEVILKAIIHNYKVK